MPAGSYKAVTWAQSIHTTFLIGTWEEGVQVKVD